MQIWSARTRPRFESGDMSPQSKAFRAIHATKILESAMSRLPRYFMPANVSSADNTFVFAMKAETRA